MGKKVAILLIHVVFFFCSHFKLQCSSLLKIFFYFSDLETKTLQGVKSENSLSTAGSFLVENSSIDFQKFPDKEILRMSGPLTADFTIKVRVIGRWHLRAT